MIRRFLALAAVGLGALLYLQWSGWPPAAPAPPVPAPAAATQPANDQNPAAGLKQLDDKDEYAAVKERPLFRPDRRPQTNEPEDTVAPPVEAPGELNGMDLTGILISPTLSTAWVKDPAQPLPVRLRRGETLVGWTVQDIEPDRLVLERQGKTDTLILRDFNKPGASAPPPAAPRPAAATPRPPPAARPAPAGTKKAISGAQGRSPLQARRGAPATPPPSVIIPPEGRVANPPASAEP
jgi:general secretion pathway protein N